MHHLLPKETPAAIVLLLHGLGADGRDLIGLGEGWRPVLPRTAFFAPDAPEACDLAPFGFQWFSLRQWNMEAIEAGLKHARPLVDAMIDDLLKKYSLPPSKLVLGGFSQGCMLSLYAGLQRKEALAGILGYSGALFGFAQPPLRENAPAVARSAEQGANIQGAAEAKIMSRPPVFLSHGTQDEVVPFSASQLAAHTLQKENINVELHLIERLGHGIDPEGLDLGAKFLQRVLEKKKKKMSPLAP
ncbi:MAG: prolyl oligopeptidase family serine peptidase [Proteobacteria bacterium]|nr:prolyl oligopeptidase family serine peptidase [Pseudomonadota bacterium]